MPKIKSSRTAAKRFKLTKNGKVKFKRAYMRHMMTCKTRKEKRQLRAAGVLGKAEAQKIKLMLPYA